MLSKRRLHRAPLVERGAEKLPKIGDHGAKDLLVSTKLATQKIVYVGIHFAGEDIWYHHAQGIQIF